MTKYLVMQDDAGNDHILKVFNNKVDAEVFCNDYNFGSDPDHKVYVVGVKHKQA